LRQATQTEPCGLASVVRLRRVHHQPRVSKAHRSLEVGTDGDVRVDACKAHPKHLPPAWGQRVGGVSGRPAQEAKRSDPLPRLLPRRWKAPRSTESVASFAGRRKSVGLGRFVQTWCRISFPHCGAPTTAGVLWKNEEGNVVGVRQAYALDSGRRANHATSAARGHVLRSVQRPVHVNRH